MASHKKKRTAIKVPMPIASNLEEIGRFLEDASDKRIEKSRNAALAMLVEQFIEEQRGQFTKKEPAEGGDLPHFVYRGNRRVDIKSEGRTDEDGDGGSDTEDHLSFSMKDGPS